LSPARVGRTMLGIDHVAAAVRDLDAAVAGMIDAGGEVVHEATIPATRDEATLHPNSWFGLQIQLLEWHDEVGPTARDHIEAVRAAEATEGAGTGSGSGVGARIGIGIGTGPESD